MTSIYTDKVREQRYFACRKCKKQCEIIFGICIGLYLLLVFAELMGGFFAPGLAVGLGVNGIAQMQHYHLLINFAVFAVGFYGIASRNWVFMLAAAVGVALITFAGWYCAFYIGTMTLLPLGCSVFAGLKWSKLKGEEGFPLFQIDFSEQETRTKSQVSFMQQRALAEGVRTEQQALDPHAHMNAVEEKAAPDALPAMLQNYHNRGAGSDPIVHAAEPAFDRMKQLNPDAPGFERKQTLRPEDVGGLDTL